MTPATPLTILSLPDAFAIAQLPAGAAIPEWATRGPFLSITRTTDELSIVCRDEDVPAQVRAERGWRCLRVAGKLDFTVVGILASVIDPLAEAGVPVFVLSTFETDYMLIKERDFQRAVGALQAAGYLVASDPSADPA